jgi:hypothetical protein
METENKLAHFEAIKHAIGIHITKELSRSPNPWHACFASCLNITALRLNKIRRKEHVDTNMFEQRIAEIETEKDQAVEINDDDSLDEQTQKSLIDKLAALINDIETAHGEFFITSHNSV